jgi:predicted flap endonuclease-1-like 5' DNA nuclease
VTALRSEKWAEAVYAAGVLSHYYTDPVHPFHTGQTEAENAIHRAVEWSINRSYDKLRALGVARFGTMTVTSHTGAHWLKEMTCDGAEFSHRYYEKLIAHFDFTRGVVHPEEGLDETGRTVVAELLMYAADGFGHLLDRAIAESGVEAPGVTLTAETVIAALKIPSKWIAKKLANAEDRRIVEAMYDELKATGRVEHTLTQDDRTIRDLYKREVLDAANERLADKRAVRVPEGDPAEVRRAQAAEYAQKAPVKPAALAGVADPTGSTQTPAQAKPRRRIEIDAEILPEAEPDAPPAPSALSDRPIAPGDAPASLAPQSTQQRRYYLSAVDDLERAPSIGPKTAERFAAFGIKTVADFLARKPEDLAGLLKDKRLDARTLAEWQDQTQLVLEIAGLRGTHAQLLTGTGYRAARDIAAADPVAFSAEILKFASSDAGKRILRDGDAPDIARIKAWVEAAQLAKAA